MKTLPLLLTLILTGCGVPCHSVSAMKDSFDLLSSEYREYVEADEEITERERAAKIRHVEDHRALLRDLEFLCEGE